MHFVGNRNIIHLSILKIEAFLTMFVVFLSYTTKEETCNTLQSLDKKKIYAKNGVPVKNNNTT